MQTWRVIPDSKDERRGRFIGPATDVPCALGRGGVIPEGEKREGDGKTPLGRYPFRQVFYRPDKMSAPVCNLPLSPISPDLGWCDDPKRPKYNQLVRLPFSGSHEKMWRDDSLYDVVLVVGHNDDPPVSGLGSAIFMHVARDGFKPTEGCIALEGLALLALIRTLQKGDQLQVGQL